MFSLPLFVSFLLKSGLGVSTIADIANSTASNITSTSNNNCISEQGTSDYISEQGTFVSKLTLKKHTTIKVPSNVFVTGSLFSSHPYYFIKSGYIHKLPKKLREIKWRDNEGIKIKVIGKEGSSFVIRDKINVAEGDSFYYGFLGNAMLISLLFNFLF